MWHAAVEPQLRALLQIPDDVFLAATVTLGKPAGNHGPVRRRPLDHFVYDGVGPEPGMGGRPARHPPHQRRTTPSLTPQSSRTVA